MPARLGHRDSTHHPRKSHAHHGHVHSPLHLHKPSLHRLAPKHEQRRSTDADGFDPGPSTSRPAARPDGQGPLQAAPSSALSGGRRSSDSFTGAPVDESLGELSRKYESGKSGPGTVSGGQGDAGGVSYGTYQLSSKHDGKPGGTASEFLRSLKVTHPEYYSALAGRDPSKLTDEEIIKAVYKERGRQGAHGLLVHFSRNARNVQAGVARRFESESQDALDALRREKLANP